MRWIVLALILLISAALLGREILAIGAARRRGTNPLGPIRRFRRRAKGLLILVFLYVSAAWFEDLALTGYFTLREGILYMGGFVILLIWLLILLARDLRETAREVLAERQMLALESLAGIEEEIIRHRKEKKGTTGKESEAKRGGEKYDVPPGAT